MSKYLVTLTFKEPLLGTVPKNKDIYKDFIASKASLPENGDAEIDSVDDREEKGWTGFHMNEGNPFLLDYMVKGFFKDACSMLKRAGKNKSSELKAQKKVIDGLVFVSPRQIMIDTIGRPLDVIERPLRAQTALGERVTLARSDVAPAGSKIGFEVNIVGGVSKPLLEEWLKYGELRGLGQWRNAGYGSFVYTLQ